MPRSDTLVVFSVSNRNAAHDLLKRLHELDYADDNVKIKAAAFAVKVSKGHIHLEQYSDLGAGHGAFRGGAIGILAGTIVAGPLGAAIGGVSLVK